MAGAPVYEFIGVNFSADAALVPDASGSPERPGSENVTAAVDADQRNTERNTGPGSPERPGLENVSAAVAVNLRPTGSKQRRKPSPAGQSSRLLKYILRVFPSTLLSYMTFRLPRDHLIALVPEVMHIEARFRRRDRQAWWDEMESYNATVRRGTRMGLVPPSCSLSSFLQRHTFDCLDTFLLCVHSTELARVLNGLSTFAERVLQAHRSGSDLGTGGNIWHLSSTIILTKDSWQLFCQGFVDLLALLNFRIDAHPAGGPTRSWWNSEAGLGLEDHHPWPDRDALAQAGRRAMALIGGFAAPSVGPLGCFSESFVVTGGD